MKHTQEGYTMKKILITLLLIAIAVLALFYLSKCNATSFQKVSCFPESQWDEHYRKGETIYNSDKSGGVRFSRNVNKGDTSRARDIISFGTQESLRAGDNIPEYIRRGHIRYGEFCSGDKGSTE